MVGHGLTRHGAENRDVGLDDDVRGEVKDTSPASGLGECKSGAAIYWKKTMKEA